MKEVIKIENLNYKNILNDISFNIEENTFNVLLGPNSSGKTTLALCIVDYIKYSGNIYNKYKDNTTILSDNTILIEDIVFNNLINLYNNDIDIKTNIYELARYFNIEYILFKNIDELSSEELKLVKVISILVNNPKFVIIDDDLSDISYENNMKLIKYLKNKKITTLLLASNFDYNNYIDNYIFLNNGTIILIDKPINIINDINKIRKNNILLPFNFEILDKLKDYDLIKDNVLSLEQLVDNIWQ